MSAEKLFWHDPYLSTAEAQITSVNGDTVTLDRTIIFAFSGGQASDSGTIGGYEIIEARKSGREIFYRIDENHTLRNRDAVGLTIDMGKRRKLIRLHFAAEIILELVYRNCGRPEKRGANITEQKARLDFAMDENISGYFPILLDEAQKLIAADLPVESRFVDEENELRCWEVPGFGRVECGGTHPRSTGEVGGIRLRRDRPGKGLERIEIYLTD